MFLSVINFEKKYVEKASSRYIIQLEEIWTPFLIPLFFFGHWQNE